MIGVGDRAIRKVYWRIMPFLMTGLFICSLDRLNITFAAVKMNADLGLSVTQFGLIISAFYVGYFLAGIPSNMALERIGARRWFAILLFLWGLMASATALCGGFASLVPVRFLLGLAEGGYPPGVLVLLTLWVPDSHRGRFIGWTLLAGTIGNVVSSVLSGFIIAHGATGGLAGWQMMFIIQGIPASILGVLIWKFLADGPEQANWLTEPERDWLIANLDRPKGRKRLGFGEDLAAVANRRMLLMAGLYLTITMCGYASSAFIPLILTGLGYSIETLGLILALPPLLVALSAPHWGRWSDRAPRKEYPCMASLSLAVVGYLGMAVFNGTQIAFIACCIAVVGVGGSYVTFWPLNYSKGGISAFAVAFLYSVGSAGGILSPFVFGLLKDITADFAMSLAVLSIVAGIGILCVFGSRLIPAAGPGGMAGTLPVP